MAKKVLIIDDLDGSEDAQTITYAFDGQEYEIDLSEENFNKAAIDFYMKVSRPVDRSEPKLRTPTRRRRAPSAAGTRSDLAYIRKWAQKEGIEVAPRGRIKQEIIDKYDQAQET